MTGAEIMTMTKKAGKSQGRGNRIIKMKTSTKYTTKFIRKLSVL